MHFNFLFSPVVTNRKCKYLLTLLFMKGDTASLVKMVKISDSNHDAVCRLCLPFIVAVDIVTFLPLYLALQMANGKFTVRFRATP
jgi:hypothetical protein